MTARAGPAGRLLADIGGTNVRFALAADGAPHEIETLACAEFPGPAEAASAYLRARGVVAAAGAFAVAAPLSGDQVTMTNGPWSFSIEDLRYRLGFSRLDVVNDFTAQAFALPHLGPADRRQVGGGSPAPGAPLAVLGPGTGLGVSGLLPADGGWAAVTGEGGHRTMAAADDRETAVLSVLRHRLGHVSAERVLSGPGLVNLLHAICVIEGETPPRATPTGVTRRALDGSSAFCAEALRLFCAMLGTAASDLALMLGARGGVFVSGGIVPGLGDAFLASPFRARFEDKGRYRDYLAAIPTYVVTHEAPALVGLAARGAAAGAGAPA